MSQDRAVRANRLESQRQSMSKLRAAQTPQQRKSQLEAGKHRMALLRAAETSEQRKCRLEAARNYRTKKKAAAKLSQNLYSFANHTGNSSQTNTTKPIITTAQIPHQPKSPREPSIDHFTPETAVKSAQTCNSSLASGNHQFSTDSEPRIFQQHQIQFDTLIQNTSHVRATETSQHRKSRLETARQRMSQIRSAQTLQQRKSRLETERIHKSQMRAAETPQQRNSRLESVRLHMSQIRAARTPQQRRSTLHCAKKLNANIDSFYKNIFTFANKTCTICTKQCYPHQVTKYVVSSTSPPYLPSNLASTPHFISCHRCNKHLNSRNTTSPPKAFWNCMDPGSIPEIIQQLSQPELRLLSRVIPFVKIIKFHGLFGQYGFRGQAVLFAQDIFEVSEKLPHMLPRSTDTTGLVVVTEHLDNINITRQFSISRPRVFEALQWLITNNPLYKDVIIDHDAQISQDHFIRVTDQHPVNDIQPLHVSAYMPINTLSYILRASWHQANPQVFTSGYAGVQCCAMVVANIVRAAILPPSQWSTNTLNANMIEGDNIYQNIILLAQANTSAYPVHVSGHLELRNFDVLNHELTMYNTSFSLDYDQDTSYYGTLKDNMNRDNFGMTLVQALHAMFNDHQAGALIAVSKTLGVMHYDNKFYFTDSHSCGPKGAPAIDGRACVIQCDTLQELARICKRSTGSRNDPFTLNHISVHLKNEIVHQQPLHHDQPQLSQSFNQQLPVSSQVAVIPVKTSVMAPIDCMQPDVDEELEVSHNVNQIVRKTKDNIVNEAHESKAEEFAWFYLFPYGVNGLKEENRPVRISPLDYFQYRLLSSDTRFQCNDYLFYALSMFEYYRVKSTIAACGKKIEGQDGMVEDVHLYIKNLRGSSAYWRTALYELIAQIRCLGPPTYFVTFSCNDLNWLDMRKALLVADGRPDVDPNHLTTIETQHLIEHYPVIVSRHFMVRVNALMKFITNNHDVFCGILRDYWWRIEFQNRGSPHLHMVLWIENYPPFDTEEGISLLDKVCTCLMPPECSELYTLVKNCQTHRHTHSCKKNNTSTSCRFSFPRQQCLNTRIVAHSSDDFLRSGGRICILKRRKDDEWVNNYNPTLLRLWQGNMDIQPCGSNEAIAFYIAKYISKSEPTQLDHSVAQAIQQIRREESNVSRKLFKICMRIMKERQVSACECAFRLCHLNLRDSSRKCVFVNTRTPQQRYKVLKFDGTGRATGYCANIFERYQKRPTEHVDYDFKNMTLLEFAMLFEPYYAKHQDESEVCIDQYEMEQPARKKLITLLDNTKLIVRRTPAVIRVPYFVAAKDPENYFYSLLLQYMPFHIESELLEDFDTARESFLAKETVLRETSRHMECYRQRDRQLENAFNQIHAFEILQQEPFQTDIEEEEIPDQLMTDDHFHAAQSAMNGGQTRVFKHITQIISDQLNGSHDRLMLFITGNAGTGKTFLFNLLKNQANRCFATLVVKVCALTGVAARLVGGSTLHSTLKLPVQKDGKIVQMPMLTGNFLRLMRQQWKNIQFLFIDEISMVPYEMLCMIDSRLKQLKNSDEFFGGINILLFGDLMQLPPVRGHQVFQQPEGLVPGTHLWRLFTLVELQENMRQHGSNTFVDILNALRIGELRADHFAELMKKVSTETTGDFSIENALRIYPTNDLVHKHNQTVLQHFRDKGANIFKINAHDILVDATRHADNIDINSIIPSDINKTGGLPKILEIFEGAKIMLRSNIDVPKGLVNGAIGFVTEVIWPYFRRAQMYETDIPSVRVHFENNGIHLIHPVTIQFPAKFGYGTAERRMLPMVLSWASTVHKMQGSTVDNAVIYLGSKLFAAGQAYVALSRVRSLDGLRIEDLDCSRLIGKTPCNNDALSEMKRMRDCASSTL